MQVRVESACRLLTKQASVGCTLLNNDLNCESGLSDMKVLIPDLHPGNRKMKSLFIPVL